MTARHGLLEGASGGKRDIEVGRVCEDVPNRAGLALHLSSDDPDSRAVGPDDLGNLHRGDVLVTRPGHLELRGQVHPDLEPVQPTRSDLGHLLVHDAAARRHPLHVAGPDHAGVPEAVPVLDPAVEHVGDRFDSAVRVHGESGDVVVRALRAEVIEEEERVEMVKGRCRDAAPELHARAILGWARRDDRLHFSLLHAHLLLLRRERPTAISEGQPNCTDLFVNAPSIHQPVIGNVAFGGSSAAAPAATRTGA